MNNMEVDLSGLHEALGMEIVGCLTDSGSEIGLASETNILSSI